MSRESEAGTIVTGTYVGRTATVLADGRPIAPGDTVMVDSRGEDAHLIAVIAASSVREVKPRRAKQ